MINLIQRKNFFFFSIILIFILSRHIYYYLGIRFEIFLDAWQYLPIEFYKNDLLNSIFFNFSQPPLLNLLVGVAIKLSINNYILILNFFYLIISLLTFLCLFTLIVNLNFKKIYAFLIVLVLMIFPTTILLENHGYKDFLVCSFLVFSVHFSLKVLQSNKIKYFIFLGISVSLLCLLRETFHVFWAYILFFFIFLITRNTKIITSILIITVFVLTFYIKNFLIFNSFQLGGWMYENLNQKAQFVSRLQNQDKWIKKIIFKNEINYNSFVNELSPIWKIAVFTSAYEYKKILNYKYKYNHSLLHTNTFHNEVMIEVDRIRKGDFYKYLRNYPEIFIFSTLNALVRHFFNSTDSFLYFQNNSSKIVNLIKLSDCLKLTMRCFYEKKIPQKYHLLTNSEKIWFSLNQINFLLVFVYILFFFKIFFKSFKFKNLEKKEKIIFFWSFSIIFNLIILILFEDTEIPRHRFPFDYLVIIFLIYICNLFKNKNIRI